MRSMSDGAARPVLIDTRSRLSTSIAFFIRSSASLITSSVISVLPLLHTDPGAHVFSHDYPQYVTHFLQVEYYYGQVVIFAQCHGRGVHHPQVQVDCLPVAQLIELL